jgi:hypothetical protein
MVRYNKPVFLRNRRRKTAAADHIGIRLRISNLSGELVDATSDHLYLSATYGERQPCGPSCRPGCDRHGWLELIPGLDPALVYAPSEPRPCHLKIEIKPVILPGPGDVDDE